MKSKIVNHVIIDGTEKLLEDLTEEERKRLAELWQDRIMTGFKRDTA